MYQMTSAIERLIKNNLDIKSHYLLSSCGDVFVENVDKQTFFIDFEARNKSDNYYRVRGEFSLHDMMKKNLISEHAYELIMKKIDNGEMYKIVIK